MNGVSKITVTEDVALVTFPGIELDLGKISEIFLLFAGAKINLDMISQTVSAGDRIDLSFTLPAEELVPVLELVHQFKDTHKAILPMVSSGNCKVQLYGKEMREMYGVAAEAIAAVAKAPGVEVTLITTSEVDISLLMPMMHCDEALRVLEDTFNVIAEHHYSNLTN